MIPESQRSFVARLRRETEAGTLTWMGGSENAFFCSHKKYTVHLAYSFDDNKEVSIYRLTLIADGREAGFSVDTYEGDFQEMSDLYSSVSINAAGFQNIEDDFFGD